MRNRPPLLGDGQCCKLFAVMAIGMWGSTPVRTTGVLVIDLLSIYSDVKDTSTAHCMTDKGGRLIQQP